MNELLLHYKKNIHDVKSQTVDVDEIPEETFICGQCSITFETLPLCEEHINGHKSKCFKCQFETTSIEELEHHEKVKHKSAVSLEKSKSPA